FTAPAACAGVVAVICVLFTTVTLVAAVPPNVTIAPLTKFVPAIVTAVPPVVEPLFGVTLVTPGAGPLEVKPFVKVPGCVSGVVTRTFPAPAACAGVVAVSCVLLTNVTLVAAVPPNVTVAPVTKFVPAIVTAVPPDVEPLFGVTLVTPGAGAPAALKVAICIT